MSKSIDELKQLAEAALANQPDYKEDGWDPWWDSKECNEFLAFAAAPTTVLKLLEMIAVLRDARKEYRLCPPGMCGPCDRLQKGLDRVGEIERSLGE